MNLEIEKEERTRRLAFGTVIAFGAVVVIMAATGHFSFFTKTAIVPILFLVALIARRFVVFVKEWAIFLSLVVLFDSLRGYAYYLTVNFDLDVYMNYVIDFETALFDGKILTQLAQEAFLVPGRTGWFERILTVAHGSHFLVFLLFGFLIWFTRKEDFPKFRLGMILVMYGGLLGYFLVPTVPPWMASDLFGMLPDMDRMVGHVYNTGMPRVRAAFDINPIAAMPSLHTAFPVFLTAVALTHYRARGIPFILYTILVVGSLIVGAEHYLLDVIGGVVLSMAVYFLVYRSDILARISRRLMGGMTAPRGRLFSLLDTEIKRKLAVTAFILVLSEISGQIVLSEPLPIVDPTREFIEEQMMGRSKLANYYLGVRSYTEKKFSQAVKEMQVALTELEKDSYRKNARSILSRCAYLSRDFALAAKTLGEAPWEDLSKGEALMMASALFELERLDDGLAVLDRLDERYPCDAETAFLRALAKYENGVHGPQELLSDIAAFEKRADTPRAARYAAVLRNTLASRVKKPDRRADPGGLAAPE